MKRTRDEYRRQFIAATVLAVLTSAAAGVLFAMQARSALAVFAVIAGTYWVTASAGYFGLVALAKRRKQAEADAEAEARAAVAEALRNR